MNDTNKQLHHCFSQAIAQLEQARYILVCMKREIGTDEDSVELKEVKVCLDELKALRSSL